MVPKYINHARQTDNSSAQEDRVFIFIIFARILAKGPKNGIFAGKYGGGGQEKPFRDGFGKYSLPPTSRPDL